MDGGIPPGRGSRALVALKAVGGVELAIFAARPEKVVAVTTLGNYSDTSVTRCR
jgi:hypothetical protein